MDLRIDVRTGTQLRRHLAPFYSAVYTFAFEFERKPHTPLYWREPKDDCKACESFGTLLARSGKVSEAHVCFGAKECYEEKYLTVRSPQTQAGTSLLSGKPAGPAAAQDDKPRVDWHGESFRQDFYKEQIPIKALELSAEAHAKLLLFVLVKVSSWGINEWLQQRLGLDGYSYSGQDGLLAVLSELPSEEIDQLAKDTVMWLIFNHKDFGDMGRQAVAEFVEVDLNDWSLHEAYLKLKTKKEIVQIILQSGLMQDEAFLRRLRLANVDMKVEALLDKKKEYLVSMILESGAELRGKLPKEIANKKAISPMTRREQEAEPETVEDFSPVLSFAMDQPADPSPDLAENQVSDPDLTAGDPDIPTPYDSDWSQVPAPEPFDQTVPEELAVA